MTRFQQFVARQIGSCLGGHSETIIIVHSNRTGLEMAYTLTEYLELNEAALRWTVPVRVMEGRKGRVQA